jgi:hypothetical protein
MNTVQVFHIVFLKIKSEKVHGIRETTFYILDMMKLLEYLKHMMAVDGAVSPEARLSSCSAWYRDPLSHPAVDRMSERELADLPFDRGRKRLPARDG